MYICIHARRLIIINPCLLPTVINLYSSPDPNSKPNPEPVSRARNKGSSSLIYACRINLPLPFLSPRGRPSVPFLPLVSTTRISFLRGTVQRSRSRSDRSWFPHLGHQARPFGPATPIMRARVILCKYFPRRLFAQARPPSDANTRDSTAGSPYVN